MDDLKRLQSHIVTLAVFEVAFRVWMGCTWPLEDAFILFPNVSSSAQDLARSKSKFYCIARDICMLYLIKNTVFKALSTKIHWRINYLKNLFLDRYVC